MPHCKPILAASLLAALLLAVPVCWGQDIQIAMVNDQTGPNQAAGKAVRGGAAAYFKAVNDRGGVNGQKIELLSLDDQYEPEKTVDGLLKLLEEHKPVAVMTTIGTSNGVSILPIVKEYKLPFVNPRSGAEVFRKPLVPEVINIRASHQEEIDALVDRFVKDVGAKRFAVFYQNDTFGADVLTCVENALKRHGLPLVSKGSYERLTTAVVTALTSILEGNPDVVILATISAPGGAFIKAARKVGMKAYFATGSFAGGGALIKAAESDAEGLIMSQVVPYLTDLSVPITKECKEAIEKYPEETPFNVISFEGCVVAKALAEALKGAGAPATRQGVFTAFETMKGVDIGGVRLTLSPESHQAQDGVWLVKVKGGKALPLVAVDK